ncbi:hypothetical protein [Alkalibacillus almallahensis]|uniref:LexA family protein n=1 Tax=Alkalibacillus almallahensis TaxID=1379154 RepID=UPI001423A96C|nr:hypothetical protein [Alkalibacillus almallahensis]NIK10886.1 SOS-response transcriptional repressor LexA [Alkalibacillus almallahensis]
MHLTMMQKAVLTYIERFQDKHGYAPSQREITSGINLKSASTVHGHLERLEEKGFIKRKQFSPRALTILVRSDEADERTINVNT